MAWNGVTPTLSPTMTRQQATTWTTTMTIQVQDTMIPVKISQSIEVIQQTSVLRAYFLFRHGTRCAGEIAMAANNSICGVGIAWVDQDVHFLVDRHNDRLVTMLKLAAFECWMVRSRIESRPKRLLSTTDISISTRRLGVPPMMVEQSVTVVSLLTNRGWGFFSGRWRVPVR